VRRFQFVEFEHAWFATCLDTICMQDEGIGFLIAYELHRVVTAVSMSWSYTRELV